jgi:hypothetical protein
VRAGSTTTTARHQRRPRGTDPMDQLDEVSRLN